MELNICFTNTISCVFQCHSEFTEIFERCCRGMTISQDGGGQALLPYNLSLLIQIL